MRLPLVAAVLLGSSAAHADLTDLVNSGVFPFNALEREAARANQAVFDTLSPLCAGGGCSADQLEVLGNVTELVHTANALLGAGPTSQSLGLGAQGLGFALRWTAAEELAAQGSMATEFTNGQLANLASRLTALRYGATGFSIAGIGGLPVDEADGLIAEGFAGSRRGAASAGERLSGLGGFLNVSYGYGDKDPTVLEDAFDFDNIELTAGLDYRFDSGVVVGGAVGYTNQETEFDPTRSIVDGGIDADGLSFNAFTIYSGGHFYASALLGYQSMEYVTDRFIRYPSFNPAVESVDARTRSSADSDALTATVALGYTFEPGAFSIEPYLRSEYVDIEIDDFAERDLTGDGFDFLVSGQSFSSFDTAFGVRAAAVVSLPFGVFIPYLRGELHIETDDESRVITTDYDPVAARSGTEFGVPTDERDNEYYTVAAGISGIIRGGRVRGDSNVVTGGLRMFIECRAVLALEDISNNVITGGVRYEF